MATSAEFKDFVVECLERASSEIGLKLRFDTRKMFGEYCVYAFDGGAKKVLFLLCDEMVFAKKFEALNEFTSQNAEHFDTSFPFEGAKEHFIIDIENTELLGKFLQILLPLLPALKPKKAKKAKMQK